MTPTVENHAFDLGQELSELPRDFDFRDAPEPDRDVVLMNVGRLVAEEHLYGVRARNDLETYLRAVRAQILQPDIERLRQRLPVLLEGRRLLNCETDDAVDKRLVNAQRALHKAETQFRQAEENREKATEAVTELQQLQSRRDAAREALATEDFCVLSALQRLREI